MKLKYIGLSCALFCGLVTAASAELDPYRAVTSKAYVDDTKQSKISGYASGGAASLLTDSATDGTVQKRAIFDGATTYAAATHSTHIPTMGAVMSAISSATPNLPTSTAGNVVTYDSNGAIGGSVATYTGVAPYNATNDSAKIPTMAGVTNYAQSKIAAGTYEDNNNNTIPGVIVSSDTAGTVNQRVLLEKTSSITSQDINDFVAGDAQGLVQHVSSDFTEEAEIMNSVPTTEMTLAIITSAASGKQNKIAAGTAGNLVTYSGTEGSFGTPKSVTTTVTSGSSDIPTSGAVYSAVDAKQNKIAAGTAGNLVTYSGTSGSFGTPKSVTTAITSGGTDIPTDGAVYSAVDAKQNKIAARETKINNNDQAYATSVVTNGTTAGDVGQMAILTQARKTTDGYNLDDYGNADSLIPTAAAVANDIGNAVNAMYGEFQTKISAGTAGNLVTYSGTSGSFGTPKSVTTAITSGGTDIPTDGAVYTAINNATMGKTSAYCTLANPSNSNECYVYRFESAPSCLPYNALMDSAYASRCCSGTVYGITGDGTRCGCSTDAECISVHGSGSSCNSSHTCVTNL